MLTPKFANGEQQMNIREKFIKQLTSWIGHSSESPIDLLAFDHGARTDDSSRNDSSCGCSMRRSRRISVEQLEPRQLMAADVRVGAVYIEKDSGTDLEPDKFYVSFLGGAPNTQLQKVVFDGDLYQSGLSRGDMIFDTSSGGLGSDESHPFKIESLETKNSAASVKATVVDGSSQLVLEFTDFVAGDKLVFSIDVDEVAHMKDVERDIAKINEGIDPIASGIEFQETHFAAHFTAPHYENASGTAEFVNLYDSAVDPLGLGLPRDNDNGRRDRSTGVGLTVKQTPKPISLAGTVWVDSNEDLKIGAGETRLSNVSVELFKLEGTQYVATGHRTQTDSLGRYSFGTALGLKPGVYQVRQTQPSGYYSVGAVVGSLGSGQSVGQLVAGNSDLITQIDLNLGDSHAVELNFAENLPSSLSGHVCYVTSGMDCFSADSQKAPQANILVELLDSSGKVVSSARTDADGKYMFAGLRAGAYALRQTNAAGKIDGGAKAGSKGGGASDANNITQIILGGGVEAQDYDFCDLVPAEISGHTYFDANNNGMRDPNEDPLTNVKIELRDATGTIVATTTTDDQGFYSFTNLRPGVYQIVEETPAGYLPGQASPGSVGGQADSTGDVIKSISLGSGAKGLNYDFGELLVSSLSGSVYVDSNGDCIRQETERPLAGVMLTLLDASGTVVATTTTDSSGNYLFSNLQSGQYTVRQTQPAGYLQGGQKAGSGGGNDSIQDVISAISIGAGVDLLDYDFCEQEPGSIAGTVFVDSNSDCIQSDDERGLSGIRVELLDVNGNVVAQTTTDSQGNYQFKNLTPGEYTVRESQPVGFFQGGQTAPETGGDDSVQDVIGSIIVGSGQHITDANFCEIEPAKLSGFVFQDGAEVETRKGVLPVNIAELRDGVRSTDDTPIAGVRIRLFDGLGKAMRASDALPGSGYSGDFVETTTDALGRYEFVGLPPGIYYVFEIQPTDYRDYIDTPGTTGGTTLNSSDEVSLLRGDSSIDLMDIGELSDEQLMDAILAIPLLAGQHSEENNFSELKTRDVIFFPPPPDRPVNYSRPAVGRETFPGIQPLEFSPLQWSPLPIILGVNGLGGTTWHLSVINGGTPRGARNGDELAADTIVDNADYLNFKTWTVKGMSSSKYRYISTGSLESDRTQSVFYVPGAKPLMGDFNGDGFDELALFLAGEWFIDANGNGRWDESDIWLKLGTKGDQPVVGDWDGDGKDDAGVFGRKWPGDERALAAEPGLPDPDHFVNTKRPKNVPRQLDEVPETPRLMAPSREGRARADVIDHVFQMGSSRDIAISGQFNEDGGVATIGTFRDGLWKIDTNGDGKPNKTIEFGEAGDLPLVGDFVNQDGVDEIAIVRGNKVIVDSNGNGQIDVTDQVFLLESTEGTVIVGDFDGDGNDEPALYQSPEQQRSLQARRAAS
jgi:serine-aspartate repeat-containing protein C/D/E